MQVQIYIFLFLCLSSPFAFWGNSFQMRREKRKRKIKKKTGILTQDQFSAKSVLDFVITLKQMTADNEIFTDCLY